MQTFTKQIEHVSFTKDKEVAQGVRMPDFDGNLAQANTWLKSNPNVNVVNVETLYQDNSSYGGYQPMQAGIRVWYITNKPN